MNASRRLSLSSLAAKATLLSLLVFLGIASVLLFSRAPIVRASTSGATLTLAKETIPAGGQDFHFTVDLLDSAVTDSYQVLRKWGSSGSANGQFNQPKGVAVSDKGFVYVVDSANNRIQRFDSSGTYLAQWGSSGSGNGQFNQPKGVAVSDKGFVYVVDSANNRIQKFDSSGRYLAQWGSSGSANGRFDAPSGVAVDSLGNVYVADTGNDRIQKFDSSGRYLVTQWGGGSWLWGSLSSPEGVAVDRAGNVYVADTGNDRVLMFDSSGAYLRQWQMPTLFGASGMAVDAGGNVYVSDKRYYNNFIHKFESQMVVAHWEVPTFPDDPYLPGPSLYGVAIDRAGRVYVTDTENDHIIVFAHQRTATIDGGQTQSYSLTSGDYLLSELVPAGWSLTDIKCGSEWVEHDGTGSTMVTLSQGDDVTCSFRNRRRPTLTISKQTTTPERGTGFNFTLTPLTANFYPFLTKWGVFGSGDGQFYHPTSVAVDVKGNVYVADGRNDRIQKFDSSGTYLTQWGSPGSGDGQFNHPATVAVDGAGNVYVADVHNHRIQKFSSSGVYLAQWGSSGSANGQFNLPVGVAVDGTGNVYVVDSANNRIQKFDSSGTYLTQWGSPGSGDGQFSNPSGVAVSDKGFVYVADAGNDRIQKFDSSGRYLAQWGDELLYNPAQVAVDGAGNIYVADVRNNRIAMFHSNGTGLTQWGGLGSGDGQFAHPFGVAVSNQGLVYVADTHNNRVQAFSPQYTATLGDGQSETFTLDSKSYLLSELVQDDWDLVHSACDGGSNSPFWLGDTTVNVYLDWGDSVTCAFKNTHKQAATLTIAKSTKPAGGKNFPFTVDPGDIRPPWSFGSFGNGNGQFSSPNGVTVSNTGFVYVVDSANNRIQKFDSNGTYLAQWGSFGSGNGQFDSPKSVAVDGVDNVYVVDNNRIQRFDSSGTYLTQWGSFGRGNGQFYYPISVALDLFGNVYVADAGNDRIQKFDSSGRYLAQWGSSGSANGRFDAPSGVAVDSLGNVYVADTGNDRIQKFDSSGRYLAQWGSFGGGNGEFTGPWAVAVDGAGNVYVADLGNQRIQKFDSSGTYLAQWGSSGSGDGEFSGPRDVAVDGAGNVYVADSNNHRIQVFSPQYHAILILDDGESEAFTLMPGTYLATELVPEDWGLTGIACDGGNPVASGKSVSVTLAGDDVTCTFANTQKTPPNTPPKADAGGPYNVNEGSLIVLSAAASTDAETPDSLTYVWDLDDDGTYETSGMTPSFTGVDGPFIQRVGVQVYDPDGESDTAETSITVHNVPPTVDAGPDQTVYRNEPISVSGTWTDPAGAFDDPYTWLWELVNTTVSGSSNYGDTAAAGTKFALKGSYTLSFTATDDVGDSGADKMTVTVLNQPPVCGGAYVDPDHLWPPNHKFTTVGVYGVTDPEGDPVKLTITAILQDEPVDDEEDVSHSPDAIIHGAMADLRAERIGDGNGRIYHILFAADDGNGGTCNNDLTVGVPYNKKGMSVDDGAIYDSTVP